MELGRKFWSKFSAMYGRMPILIAAYEEQKSLWHEKISTRIFTKRKNIIFNLFFQENINDSHNTAFIQKICFNTEIKFFPYAIEKHLNQLQNEF